MDRTDRDDRRRDLHLESPGAHLSEPGEVASAFVKAADEVLVARQHDHDHEARDERSVDQPEHPKDHVGLAQLQGFERELPELENESSAIDRQRDGQTEIENHQQPARGQHNPFNYAFQFLHHSPSASR